MTRASTPGKLHRCSKQRVLQTRAERSGARRVYAGEIVPIFDVVDRFAAGISIGYCLGRKLNDASNYLPIPV